MFVGNAKYGQYLGGKKGEEVFGVSPEERAQATNRSGSVSFTQLCISAASWRLAEGKRAQIDVAARQDNADSCFSGVAPLGTNRFDHFQF